MDIYAKASGQPHSAVEWGGALLFVVQFTIIALGYMIGSSFKTAAVMIFGAKEEKRARRALVAHLKAEIKEFDTLYDLD